VVRGGAGPTAAQAAMAALDRSLFGTQGGSGTDAARSACQGSGVGPGFHRYELSPDKEGPAAEMLAFRALPARASLLQQRFPYAQAADWPSGMAEDVWGGADNVWPSEEVRIAVTDLEVRLSGVVDGAMACLDRALSPWHGGTDVFSPVHGCGERVIEAKRYSLPPGPHAAPVEALPVHSDLTTLTALVVCPRPGGSGGLEVFDWASGGWSELDDGAVSPGDVILNVGEFGSSLTSGVLLATPHRVVMRAGARDSAVLFATPDAHTDLDTTPARLGHEAAEALVRELWPSGRGFDERFYRLSPHRYGLRGGGMVGDHLPI